MTIREWVEKIADERIMRNIKKDKPEDKKYVVCKICGVHVDKWAAHEVATLKENQMHYTSYLAPKHFIHYAYYCRAHKPEETR